MVVELDVCCLAIICSPSFGYGQGMVEDADGRYVGVVLEKLSQLLIGKKRMTARDALLI